MYRLKTQPDEEHDKRDAGCNGPLASAKAQDVANATGLVVVLERQHYRTPEGDVTSHPVAGRMCQYLGWAPDQVFFPSATGTPSKRFQG